MLSEIPVEFLDRLTQALAKQFGTDCEVLIHDLTVKDKDHTVKCIENGHVTHRKVGDGPSEVVLNAFHNPQVEDEAGYCTVTEDGRLLRSSTIYIRNKSGQIEGILSINYDLSKLQVAQNILDSWMGGTSHKPLSPQKITTRVEDLLEELIERSIQIVGKPITLMNKEDKMRAIQFLEEAGAFLITKSGDKVAECFGISKYTLYHYMEKTRT